MQKYFREIEIITTACECTKIFLRIIMTLDKVTQGQTATIVRINGDGAIHQRLLDMGITKGTEVYIERYAPLKDPIHITVKGYSLALRIAEAKMIEVTA